VDRRFLPHVHKLVTLNPRSRENVMRSALAALTGKEFVKIRPSWLRNPATGRPLEIDAWNEELKLACEFQGYQHTVFPNCFHKTYDDFERQQQRDKVKADMLRSKNIRLLEVPHTVIAKETPSFLAEHLSRWNLLWPRSKEVLQAIIEEASQQLSALENCTECDGAGPRQSDSPVRASDVHAEAVHPQPMAYDAYEGAQLCGCTSACFALVLLD
jgi:hypothetical protein